MSEAFMDLARVVRERDAARAALAAAELAAMDWAGLLGERDAAVAEVERLKAFAQKVLDFTKKPEWGKVRYMEGYEVYNDLHAMGEAASAALQGDGT